MKEKLRPWHTTTAERCFRSPHKATLVYAFGANSGDGSNSRANLIQASDGNFYGTTQGGGAYGYGTIFRITPQ